MFLRPEALKLSDLKAKLQTLTDDLRGQDQETLPLAHPHQAS